MLKVLLKKQMAEVFRGYFYNRKTNKARSKTNSIVLFILFAFLMIVVLGGTFTAVALGICFGVTAAGMGWLYFVLMSGMAIVLGCICRRTTTCCYRCRYPSGQSSYPDC